MKTTQFFQIEVLYADFTSEIVLIEAVSEDEAVRKADLAFPEADGFIF